VPALAQLKLTELHDELEQYLSTDPGQMNDVLAWWTDYQASFSLLSRMALDYLTIPGEYCFILLAALLTFPNSATSVNVECAFNKEHLLLYHVFSYLSAQKM